VHRGQRTSSPAQCVLDLAGDLDLVDLVVLGDSVVQAEAVTPEELRAAAAAWSGRGTAKVRRAMALVRRGAESPMETRLRLLVVLAGLPEPLVQVEVVDDEHGIRIRVDLCWPQWKVVLEYDGRQHAEDTAQWRRDLERREVLDRLEHRLLVVLADGIYGEPGATLDRIVRVLRERGADVHVRGTAWRRHFPGRATR
jgi:very-short-patch-repair endonuclease